MGVKLWKAELYSFQYNVVSIGEIGNEAVMDAGAVQKKKIIDTPYPLLLVKPFQIVWKWIMGDKKLPTLSDKALRISLIVLAVASLFVIWIFEGFVNPLDLLVEIPFFSYSEIAMDYRVYYLVFLPFFTIILIQFINYVICRGKEISFFSVNGLLYWITTLAISIVAESFVRNIFLEKYIELNDDLYEMGKIDLQARAYYLIYAIVFISALYFVLRDFASNALSICITPYLLIAFENFEDKFPILRSTLLVYLIVTAILKLVLNLFEKIGVLSVVTNFVIKYCFTPRYMARVYMIMLIPVCPVIIIVYFVLRAKKKK